MKPDICKKEDISLVMQLFYDKAKVDETLGPFFSDAANIDWEKHLPKMCAFWENILFFTGNYEGNPLVTHRQVNQKKHTETIHFKRWMKLFDATIDKHFTGPNATKMKLHAKAISEVMMQKI